jgi:hypothetical protein
VQHPSPSPAEVALELFASHLGQPWPGDLIMGRFRQDTSRARPNGARLRAPWAAVLVGFRQPVVMILLTTATFIMITGRPLNGLPLLVVAIGLAWDAVRSRHHVTESPSGSAAGDVPPAMSVQGHTHSGPLVLRRWRPLVIVAMVAGGVLYADVVGAFPRYSWPAAAGVIGLAVVVVALGWRGPLRPRPDSGKLPIAGAVLWAGLLLAGVMLELAALFLQPSLTTMSYAHPTISELTSPLLGTHAGRSMALGIWVAIGGYLVQR